MGVWDGNLTQIQIETDAATPDRLYGLDRDRALYRSDDRGIHWTQIRDPRWVDPPRAVAADPVNAGRLYASVDQEVFVSSDAGGRWSTLGPLPTDAAGALRSLAVSADATTLYAAGPQGVFGYALCEGRPPRTEQDRPCTRVIGPRDVPGP